MENIANNIPPSDSDIVVFTSTDREVEFQVVIDGEQDTVWATQQQMTELFGKARRTVGEHIQNLYAEVNLKKVQLGGISAKFRKKVIEKLPAH